MPSSDSNAARDDELLDELRAHFSRTDPVPDIVLAAARAAIEFRDVDAQIAELLSDSAQTDVELAGVRGDGQRLLTFGHAERFVEVEIGEAGERRKLHGYVVPASGGRVVVQGGTDELIVELDDRGSFAIPPLPAGLIRLRIETADEAALLTPWLAI